jgi:hypothetical protein
MGSAVEVVIGWKYSLNMEFFFEEGKGRSSSQRENRVGLRVRRCLVAG